MQLGLALLLPAAGCGQGGSEANEIAALISLYECVRKARCRMKWLVDIADEMLEPHKVIRFDVISRRGRRDGRTKGLNLGSRIGYLWLYKWRAVGRKRHVDIMPISMHQMVAVSDVLRGPRIC